VYETRLRSWTEFHDFVNRTLDLHYIFRGHRRTDRKLEPTLVRLIKGRLDHKKLYEDHIENFRYALRGRRGANPPSLDKPSSDKPYDLWSLGQHHGLLTPLLDWTASPYVALFFAFAKADKSTKTRTVFCLNEIRIKEISERISKDVWVEDITEFHRPLSDENSRLVTQSGLFSVSTGVTDIESWIVRNWDQSQKKIVLLKIHIPNRDREECLKALNKMNINYASLFPDIYSACKHTNMKLEIGKYW
jgi:hypothetical protein